MKPSNLLFAELFGKAFVPKKFRPNIKKFFLKAGYDEVPYAFFGALFWASTIITYLFYFSTLYPFLKGLSPAVFFLATFASWFATQAIIALVLGLTAYFYFNVKVYKRTKVLEDKLPDYLSLVSINLKGGMAFEKSLWAAIKPEFDVLAKEITIVSKSVMTGHNVKDALREFSDKYDSPLLKRTIDLLISELEGGGRIVDVIDNLVDNLKKASELKKELRVSTTTYMIFITAIVVFIAPALFGISHQLLRIISSFSQNLSGSLQASTVPFTFGKTAVSPKSFRMFSYAALIIIATFSSMIVSIVEKGDVKGGLKYIPIFIAGSLAFYMFFTEIISSLFSGIIVG